MSSTVKRLAVATSVVVALVMMATVVLVNLSDTQRNAINPFVPKPPVGAFPESLGGRTRNGELFFKDYREVGSGYQFVSYYGPDVDDRVSYIVEAFESPEAAEAALATKHYLGGHARVLAESPTRVFALDEYHYGVVAAQLAGPYVVLVTGPREAVLAFERALPYGALGVAPPAPRTAEEIEKPIPALSLLDDFQADPERAKNEMHGREFLFSGVVAGVTRSRKGVPLVAIQKPGRPAGRENTTGATFVAEHDARVMALTKGQEITFRGRVTYQDAFGFNLVFIEQARLQTP